MDRQALAVSILEEAREILARRLVERVIENRDEILDDARGESFLGDIEALHEQIGARLVHVTQILANMPPDTYEVAAPAFVEEDWAPASPVGSASSPTIAPSAAQVDMAFAANSPSSGSEFVAAHWSPPASSHISTPNGARGAESGSRSASATAASIALMTVSARVQTGELEAASRLLATLFELAPERAERCVEHFAFGASVNADFLAQVASLRQLLEAGHWQDVARILRTCFGLSMPESQRAADLLAGR